MQTVLVIHGPNLNLLGKREPEIYGKTTLAEINTQLEEIANNNKIKLNIIQSNHEGVLIDFIHDNAEQAAGILINPAAFTHYSIALRDALSWPKCPFVEVHLSDISKREEFRQHSVFEDLAFSQISGKGPASYTEGLELLIKNLSK